MADAVAETDAQSAAPAEEAPAAEAKKPAKAEGEKGAGGEEGAGGKGAGKGGGKKGSGKKGGGQEAASGEGPNVADHPRAARSIALTKSWCGLIGFLIAGYFSLPTSTLLGVGLRAVAAGMVCYVAGWGAAVFVWRRLVVLEIKAREQKLLDELRARQAALAASGSPGQSGARDAP